jgi:hypothetical protein
LLLKDDSELSRRSDRACGALHFAATAVAGAVACVLLVHLTISSSSTAYAKHIGGLEGHLISIEDLAWPLLLQMALWDSQRHIKIGMAALLTLLIALNPNRAVLLGVAYFGILAPVTFMLFRDRVLNVKYMSLIALLVVAVVGLLAYQTFIRGGDSLAGAERAVASRIVNPSFQAAVAGALASRDDPAMPNLQQTIMSKLRLSSGPGFNRYLFSAIYGDEHGGATPLLYGEAAALGIAMESVWVAGAILFLVITYLALRHFARVDVILALAIWRGSMGGLFDVLPAVIIQLGFCIFLSTVLTHQRVFRMKADATPS